jgi:hypothetical protein
MSEANTKTILALLKSGPKTITELVATTGLTRQTINKKLSQNSDVILATMTHPKKFYIRGESHKTVIDEAVDKNKPVDSRDAILHGSGGHRFFPETSHNDFSNFHDAVLDGLNPESYVLNYYRSIKSNDDIAKFEHTIKTAYDLIQFRKTLREFE